MDNEAERRKETRIPWDYRPETKVKLGKGYNAQREAKKKIVECFKEGDNFTFPTTMKQQPNDESSKFHDFAGLPGKFKHCVLSGNLWMVWLEAIWPNGKKKSQGFGVIRAARILGLEDGEC